MAKDTRLAIVVPCYNEEKLIQSTTDRLLEVLSDLEQKEKIYETSYIILVDDGSSDETWLEIAKAAARHPYKIKGVKFSSNFGNQKALIAGMLKSKEIGCSAVITIDADLQQDENKIEEFIDKFDEGYKIVFGIRNDRKTDSFTKKTTALMFYKLMNLNGIKIPKNHSDYRLVSKEVIDILEQFKESELFLRSFFHEIGFKKTSINFDVKPRKIGKSKFGFLSLLTLAANGITSYSVVPLKIIFVIGLLSMICGFIMGMGALIAKFFWNISTDGWLEVIIITSFFGGLQVFCVGIVAEYLGQIFIEVKRRPRYLIEEEIK